ncbi:malto-oligosyltrehalose trehalohydrolase [Quadrisphaera sp. DSM 44207]|uniref:malto-oligosyltrehalose trehalohydrolase n=1 Tax=Quadrisphaera sp. DSM 44207 TaxID=1881057 RepID=UPI00088B6474|nr:malto-oligosyltrehalose trehalohydrolase [Quadrisphaera sp. DSM 44207]SDQ48922.1 maltooligosyl trehalose hydrolase [Quadrisphaera sp. DSM 44207]
MHAFTVWAPAASRVDLDVHLSTGDPGADPQVRTAPMERGEGGWWRLEVPDAGHGTDYAFRLDGGDPLPDPRSAWQPHDVHGPSRLFDASRHAWSDGAWAGRDARGAVVYELHVGTFTPEGTLAAARARLDHLVDLGVEVVELMPVAAFPGRWGWGYDGVDLYAVHDPYGGPAALQSFVDDAHARGLAVALDVVYNHLGPSGNHLHAFGPYFTDKHSTPWGQAVNLDDTGSHEVRRFLVDNALRWFRDFHVDALRLDAVHALVDTSPTHLLAQLSTEVAQLSRELGRPLSLIAESDLNDPRTVEPVEAGGCGMTAQWADDVHHALHALLTGERQGYYADFGSLSGMARTLQEVFLHAGTYSSFRGEVWGAPVDRARHRGGAFVVCSTDHDQVGNRATGDRPSATLDDGQLAVAAALVLTSPFTPMVFMGEEWGARTPWQFFTDHDPELGKLVSEGRRREFAEHGWDAEEVPDPQAESTRDASVLDWSEPGSQRGARLLAWHRDLTALRRAEADLRDDRLDRVSVAHAEDASDSPWLVVVRGGLRVVVNLAASEQAVPVAGLGAGGRVLLAWDGAAVAEGSVTLPGHAVAVVRA